MKIIYLTLGLLFLLLGLIGVIMPVIPTTPFLLLTLYFFSKGSEKWRRWFIETKVYKKHLENFVEKKAMTLRQKVYILLLADTMLMFPLFLSPFIHLKVFIIFLIICKFYYFIFKIDTIKE